MDRSTPNELIRYINQKDLELPFPIIQAFFDEGERIFGGVHNSSASEYYDENLRSAKPKPRITSEFAYLALDSNPSRYFFVYYDDRRSEYFQENTRGRFACLATQERKSASNERLREIIYSEENGIFFVTISENVNERAFIEFDKSDRNGLIQPSGRMRAKYQLISATKRELVEFTADRVDEVIFKHQGIAQPARWTRNLQVDNRVKYTIYKELYIINRSQQPQNEQRGHISYEVYGTLDNPTSITISVGLGPPSYIQTIFEDRENNITIEVYRDYEEDVDILRQDPNLSFLFSEKPDNKAISSLIRDRISLLMHHWDQKQSIFISPQQLATSFNNE